MTTSPHFGHTGTAQKGASVCTADETSLLARCLCVHGGSDVLAGLSPSVYTFIGHSAPKGTISVCTRIEDICGLGGVLASRGKSKLTRDSCTKHRTRLPRIALRFYLVLRICSAYKSARGDKQVYCEDMAYEGQGCAYRLEREWQYDVL